MVKNVKKLLKIVDYVEIAYFLAVFYVFHHVNLNFFEK